MDWKEALTEIQEDGIRLGAGDYVGVEALKVAVLALEKQIPKIVLKQTESDREFVDYNCPNCKTTLQQKMKQSKRTTIYKYNHCIFCGQVLDWNGCE